MLTPGLALYGCILADPLNEGAAMATAGASIMGAIAEGYGGAVDGAALAAGERVSRAIYYRGRIGYHYPAHSRYGCRWSRQHRYGPRLPSLGPLCFWCWASYSPACSSTHLRNESRGT